MGGEGAAQSASWRGLLRSPRCSTHQVKGRLPVIIFTGWGEADCSQRSWTRRPPLAGGVVANKPPMHFKNREFDISLPRGSLSLPSAIWHLPHPFQQVPSTPLTPLPLPDQARAAEHVAAALESAAALLVQPLADRSDATEAIRSLATHVQQQVTANSSTSGGTSGELPRAELGMLDFVGWNSLTGQFETVAQGRLVPPNAAAPNHLAWDAAAGCPPPPRLAEVASKGAVLLEVGAVKLGAISAGMEAACMLLRIDGCITAAAG